jgi:phage regulator Rha-like protein
VISYKTKLAPVRRIEEMIFLIRGQRVMLDFDLARVYGVTTKVLNQAIKRNLNRFPPDFAFQVANQELAILRSQIVTSKKGSGGRRYLPWVFTEHGAIMLAGVLNSDRAVQMSVSVVRAFVGMREQLAAHKELAKKLDELEHRVSGHDEAVANLFEAIRQLVEAPPPALPEDRPRIGFMRETSPPYRIRRTCRK